jgi:hypothetical protein
MARPGPPILTKLRPSLTIHTRMRVKTCMHDRAVTQIILFIFLKKWQCLIFISFRIPDCTRCIPQLTTTENQDPQLSGVMHTNVETCRSSL